MSAFVNGHARVGGRKKGTPNKATVAWKTFVTALCEDPAVQRATRRSILKGKTELVFRAAEHAHGKPKETVDLNVEDRRMVPIPNGERVDE